MDPFDVVIGLGANQGQPIETFRVAIQSLSSVLRVERVSKLYRTAPVGPAQADFLNAALRAHTEVAPEQVLRRLLALEHELGRVRRERWGPRFIDLDLLWIRGLRRVSPELELPHPRLTERAFALRPLLDVAPDAQDPVSGRPYIKSLAALAEQRIEEVHSESMPWWHRG